MGKPIEQRGKLCQTIVKRIRVVVSRVDNKLRAVKVADKILADKVSRVDNKVERVVSKAKIRSATRPTVRTPHEVSSSGLTSHFPPATGRAHTTTQRL